MTSTSSPARPFGGVLTAMVTPMFVDGSLDYDSAAALAQHLVAHGHDGIVLNGTTGESPTTHGPEKAKLIEVVRAAVGPDIVIVAGSGSNDTKHTVRMSLSAQESGADGLLVVTPYYSKPAQAGVIAHIEAIAGASDLPIMLYDIPGRAGIRLADSTIDRLAEIDSVVALKDATGDVAGGIAAMRRTGLAWYSGDDPLNLAFLAGGASGVVSVAGHVAGRHLRAMVDAFDAGDLAAARIADAALEPITDVIMGAGLGAVYAKAAMEILGVIPSRHLRLPHLATTDEETAILRARLAELNVDGVNA